MNKSFKWVMILLLLVAAGLFAYNFTTDGGLFNKPLSPKDTAGIVINDLEIKVVYNRPSKRDRDVFGALVPFNKVWRTGANEATTFETNHDLSVNGILLPKGKYTLWTEPKADNWKVMFNSKQYDWGVNEKMEPSWDPNFDVVEVEVPAQDLNTTVEQFTIAFDNSTDNLKMTMAWDDVKIEIPLKD